ncbi:hypothetical protein KR018_000903 [Drosophila ironensis]|nr:hypothetical protein KR018_000903 [Drosophila ironensis]
MAFCGHVGEDGHIRICKEVARESAILRSSPNSSGTETSESSWGTGSPADTARTYSVRYDTEDQSMGSWSVMYNGIKQNVPPLEFSSAESSMTYNQNMAGYKLPRDADAAYETWYSAKEKLRHKQQDLQKREQEIRELELEKRKLRSQSCYEQWLKDKDKAKLARAQRLKNEMVCPPSTKSARKPRKASEEEVRQAVENWCLKKQQEQQVKREKESRAILTVKLEQERRKELSKIAWEKWISNVANKPKPVPLNQGLDSLRGTIAKLYVNPELWKKPSTTDQ